MKIIALLIALLVSINCNSQNLQNKKIFPLQNRFDSTEFWILAHTQIENMSKHQDLTEVVIDQLTIKQSIDSFYVILPDSFNDCSFKTPYARFSLFRNNVYCYSISYCYTDEINLGPLKSKFLKATFIKEKINNDLASHIIDSLNKCSNIIIIKTVDNNLMESYPIKYFQLEETKELH